MDFDSSHREAHRQGIARLHWDVGLANIQVLYHRVRYIHARIHDHANHTSRDAISSAPFASSWMQHS